MVRYEVLTENIYKEVPSNYNIASVFPLWAE